MVFNRQIRLKSRLVSMPRRDDFEIADAPLAQTKDGEVLDMTTMTSKEHYEAPLIKILAQLFRGFHYVVGISAPQPGASHRTFVFTWLGILAFMAAFCIIAFYIIVFLSVG
jgi:hypothetical protein